MAGGRPSKYKPEYAEQAYKLCLLGATDKDMADFFEVTESTFNLWKQEYPELSESLKSGKVIADIEVVQSLRKRALGYQYDEVTYEAIELKSGSGENVRIQPATKIKTVTKEVQPDVTAQIFWLKNRQRDKWRDRQEIDANVTTDGLTAEQAESLIRNYVGGTDG